jgi:NAD(P)-dependent dehydrogenase (short-subunit alcohol dehydrogenase family)
MYGLVAPPANILASPYTASKHGVVGLTKSVSYLISLYHKRDVLTKAQDAVTYAAQGIRINAICPGYVNTPLLREAAVAGAMDSEIAKTPMQRLADVEEIADSIVFLASPMASFMTGASLVVDGGYTVN